MRHFIKVSGLFFLFLLFTNVYAIAADVPVYRVNNESTGEHLFTSSDNEVQTLVCNGWIDEGISWISPDSGEGVYRLYNPNYAGGDHLYTKDVNEVEVLTTQKGWIADNNKEPLFISAGSVKVYRLYNETSGRHHLTTDENEYNTLPSQGWKQEGVSLNCLQGADNFLSPTVVRSRIMSLQNQYPEGMAWDNSNFYESVNKDLEGGYGCFGFALICSDTAFGDLVPRFHNNKNNIKVGDILRINGDTHSVVVLDVHGDNLTIVEGNYNNSIHWGRVISRNQTDMKYIVTRYPGYNEASDPYLYWSISAH